MINRNEALIPKHIGIMMDGNGRWATKRGLPRNAGHYAGMNTMRRMIRSCVKRNLKCLTLYAFSTENWTRPKDEVEYLVNLPKLFFQKDIINELNQNHVRIQTIGDISQFPKAILDIMNETIEITRENTGMTVQLAMNYGGRAEIMHALKNYVKEAATDGIGMELTEKVFETYLYTNEYSFPDLIIRTSGEQRLSNFLLWQSARSELWFTKTLWPDFDEKLLSEAIHEYQNRKQRK